MQSYYGVFAYMQKTSVIGNGVFGSCIWVL
jgi:hypothetical protein